MLQQNVAQARPVAPTFRGVSLHFILLHHSFSKEEIKTHLYSVKMVKFYIHLDTED